VRADSGDRAQATAHLGDVERLLAGVGLRDEERLRLYSDRSRVGHVERVLGVDERGTRDPALSALPP
jgi:hypothetical protein